MSKSEECKKRRWTYSKKKPRKEDRKFSSKLGQSSFNLYGGYKKRRWVDPKEKARQGDRQLSSELDQKGFAQKNRVRESLSRRVRVSWETAVKRYRIE